MSLTTDTQAISRSERLTISNSSDKLEDPHIKEVFRKLVGTAGRLVGFAELDVDLRYWSMSG